MNAAWGGISESNEISICLSVGHKTCKNFEVTGAFTVSMADVSKVRPICFDPFNSAYHVMGEKVGDAWGSGKSLETS